VIGEGPDRRVRAHAFVKINPEHRQSYLATARFAAVHERVPANNHQGAMAIWAPLARLIAKLFQEANPMPITSCFWRQGLIASPERRSPLGTVSANWPVNWISCFLGC
jgi:hypothetical protein